MKKYIPIVITILILTGLASLLISKKQQNKEELVTAKSIKYNIGDFSKQRSCAKAPNFLSKLNIPQPVVIDLSQKEYKGVVLRYGKGFTKVLHRKQWEQYGHFSTYTLDKRGNTYLVPMPFISIEATTFNLQKNIYKLDTNTGKISIFMHFDDVFPTKNNPYGISAIVYDCEDNTLWVSAIDESDYKKEKGVIYHIDIHTKKILQKVESLDVLSLSLIQSNKGKYLLAGSARDNALYAYKIKNKKLMTNVHKLFELKESNQHIRKIKVVSANKLELQSILFTYTLIVQTDKEDRRFTYIIWDKINNIWK